MEYTGRVGTQVGGGVGGILNKRSDGGGGGGVGGGCCGPTDNDADDIERVHTRAL